MANGHSGASASVVVVAADAERREQYEDALRKAQIPTQTTVEADEAETRLAGLTPDVLVLDRGLPRLVVFRLYGMVREDASEPPVQVLFVGQDGATGPGDHYLPGDPSPTNVADRVTQLLASASAEAPPAQADDAPPTPVEPARTAMHQPSGGAAATDAAAAGVASAAASTVAGTSATNGVTDQASAPAPTDATDVAASPATTDQTGEAESAEGAPDDAPKRSGRRLDVILIRVGLVLLILGALLILIQSDAYPPSLVAPGSAPATPTQRPAASPKAGALLVAPGAPIPALAGLRQA